MKKEKIGNKKNHKGLKILLIGIGVVCVLKVSGGILLDHYPQILIGLFQGYQNQNSYEPRNGANQVEP